jgi:hypothetical protein
MRKSVKMLSRKGKKSSRSRLLIGWIHRGNVSSRVSLRLRNSKTTYLPRVAPASLNSSTDDRLYQMSHSLYEHTLAAILAVSVIHAMKVSNHAFWQ